MTSSRRCGNVRKSRLRTDGLRQCQRFRIEHRNFARFSRAYVKRIGQLRIGCGDGPAANLDLLHFRQGARVDNGNGIIFAIGDENEAAVVRHDEVMTAAANREPGHWCRGVCAKSGQARVRRAFSGGPKILPIGLEREPGGAQAGVDMMRYFPARGSHHRDLLILRNRNKKLRLVLRQRPVVAICRQWNEGEKLRTAETKKGIDDGNGRVAVQSQDVERIQIEVSLAEDPSGDKSGRLYFGRVCRRDFALATQAQPGASGGALDGNFSRGIGDGEPKPHSITLLKRIVPRVGTSYARRVESDANSLFLDSAARWFRIAGARG